MRKLTISVIAAAVLLLAAAPAISRTWYVKPDSTGDVPTIGIAVDSAAAEGDTVLLADGIFTGAGNKEVDCQDKALTIVSESGDPEACIIDCGVPIGAFCSGCACGGATVPATWGAIKALYR